MRYTVTDITPIVFVGVPDGTVHIPVPDVKRPFGVAGTGYGEGKQRRQGTGTCEGGFRLAEKRQDNQLDQGADS